MFNVKGIFEKILKKGLIRYLFPEMSIMISMPCINDNDRKVY